MEARLRSVETAVRDAGFAVGRGGATDAWDLEVRAGAFGGAMLNGTVEEHGHGRQLVRWRVTPTIWIGSPILVAVLSLVVVGALRDGAWPAAAVAAALVALVVARTVLDAGQALGAAFGRGEPVPTPP
jgi:hypothetical protein